MPQKDYGPAVELAFETIASWCPGYTTGRVSGRERAIRSPLRNDKRPGSFFINEDTGEWFDHATQEGGDALTLYARIKGIKNGEARAEIMGEAYDPADDFYIEPGVMAANIAILANDELAQKEYIKLTEATPTAFKLSRYGDMTMEPPKWLIKGILEDNSLGVIFGASGHGKSYLVLDMAACIASGADFHGRKTKTQGAVVYIAGEGHAGLTKRLKAWELYNKTDISKAPLYISHRPAALCDEAFMQHVKTSVAAVGSTQRVALVIIDTWARNMAGDENSTVDTTTAIRAVDDLRALYQCSALIVHHSGQAESERGRGSSALRAALDIEYKVEIQNGIMVVKNTKMKDGEPPAPMTFAFEHVDIGIDDEDGDPIISAALEEIVLDGIVKSKPKKPGKVQVAILSTLESMGGKAPKSELKKALPGIKEGSFYAALSALSDSNSIVFSGDIVFLSHPESDSKDSKVGDVTLNRVPDFI